MHFFFMKMSNSKVITTNFEVFDYDDLIRFRLNFDSKVQYELFGSNISKFNFKK